MQTTNYKRRLEAAHSKMSTHMTISLLIWRYISTCTATWQNVSHKAISTHMAIWLSTHMAVHLQSDFSSYCLVPCQSQWILVQLHRNTADPNPCPVCFYSSDDLPYMTETKQCTRFTISMRNPKKFQRKYYRW